MSLFDVFDTTFETLDAAISRSAPQPDQLIMLSAKWAMACLRPIQQVEARVALAIACWGAIRIRGRSSVPVDATTALERVAPLTVAGGPIAMRLERAVHSFYAARRKHAARVLARHVFTALVNPHTPLGRRIAMHGFRKDFA